ncbi:MAG: RluA family pseudouridine synthase [Candidatus Ventricola sp.]
MLTHVVSEADAGRAVRSVVPRRFSLGQHAFRRLKLLGAIRVNGVPVRADYRLRAGEVITVLLPSEASEAAPIPDALPGDLPPSFIRYQDEDLLVIAKGAPLATLPSRHIASGTLREQLAAMLGVCTFAYHPVNRLDKGTSGLLCVARHAHAQRLLTAQLHTGAFVREYLAVTQGVPEQPQGVIDAPIARQGEGARRVVRADGQRAVTHYRVEQTSHGRALLRLRLETGRTHQIRVHLSHIGCPIAGDYLYGQPLSALPGRFALHSAFLRLTQPITGQIVELHEPLPDALRALL